jgi:hypothetical protein
MMRNLGGPIGTAAVEIFLTKREQLRSAIINQHLSLLEPASRNRLANLQWRRTPVLAIANTGCSGSRLWHFSDERLLPLI